MRKKLEEIFGIVLTKRKLVVGYDSKKFPKIHEFDFVSEDGSIVGEIKSTGKDYKAVLVDCLYLSKIEAKKKLIILTNPQFYRLFKRKYEGIMSNKIEVMLIQVENQK